MRSHLINNMAGDLKAVKDVQLQLRIVSFTMLADTEYGTRLASALGLKADDVKAMILANEGIEPTKWKKIELSSATSN